MTDQEREVADELAAILQGGQADSMYNSLPASHGGKVVNADIARDLSPRYTTREGRIAFTRATYQPCADYILNRYLRSVSSASPTPKTVLFLAGGAASGKTTAIGKTVLQMADLVVDSNFARLEKAVRMVDAAIQAPRHVAVIYLHRNFRHAVNDMLCRAIEDGRYIPLRSSDGQDMASLHLNAQRTIIAVAERYGRRIAVSAFRNPWTEQKPYPVEPISLATLAPGGKRCYTGTEELYAIEQEIVGEFRNQGRIPPDLLRAIGI